MRIVWILAAWTGYFVLHSALASTRAKTAFARRFPPLAPAYRLLFNAVALVSAVVPLGLAWAARGPVVWAWPGVGTPIARVLGAGAAAGFLWTLRAYDLQEFLGLRQWQTRDATPDDRQRLRISPLHRFVRHPWYFLGLVMLWTQPMDAARLASALAITAYLVVGSRLEEKKLLHTHGAPYAAYRRAVPGLMPLPWRWLTRAQADALTKAAARDRPAAL
ncbi:MAG: hypothetical protein M0037_13415 [Betaproteobacteria bacterium]|nr:hypothetical protein [Betaproteobacteria bacterium]